jgi:uroporphyrinogen decarboxylase
MIPLDGFPLAFDIRENVGPVVPEPLRQAADVSRVQRWDPNRLEFVYEGVARTVAALHGVPLIGFAGAPFTLASYLIEGAPSRTYRYTKALLWNDPSAFEALLAGLSDMVVQYLTRQVQAGAAAVQLFDSWIGALSLEDYQAAVLPHMQRIFERLQPLSVPLIYFGVGTQHLLSDMAQTGATVIGVDWRTPPAKARKLVGPKVALMGNLDPERVVAGFPAAQAGAQAILSSMGGDPGFIFNLGHGVPKETDPAVLRQLVSFVHEWGRRAGVSQEVDA